MPSKSRYPFLQLTLHDFMTVCFLLVLGIPISITSISAVLYLTSASQARHPLPPSKRHRHSCYLHIAILTLFTPFVPACYAEGWHLCTTALLHHGTVAPRHFSCILASLANGRIGRVCFLHALCTPACCWHNQIPFITFLQEPKTLQ